MDIRLIFRNYQGWSDGVTQEGSSACLSDMVGAKLQGR
jgi:hypothetical protein